MLSRRPGRRPRYSNATNSITPVARRWQVLLLRATRHAGLALAAKRCPHHSWRGGRFRRFRARKRSRPHDRIRLRGLYARGHRLGGDGERELDSSGRFGAPETYCEARSEFGNREVSIGPPSSGTSCDFSSKVREDDVGGRLRPDWGLARVLLRGSGKSTARKSQAKRLSKATDKAYFVRRLRPRAGTVVAPGPRFFAVGRNLFAPHRSRLRSRVGVRASQLDDIASGSLATVRRAALLPLNVQARACPARLCDRALREPALRVDPGNPLS